MRPPWVKAIAAGGAGAALVAATLLVVRTGPRASSGGASAAGDAGVRSARLAMGGAELQPLRVQARDVAQALRAVGSPLRDDEQAALDRAGTPSELQAVLDAHVLVNVAINPEDRVSIRSGAAPAVLDENGWRAFLVKVENESGTTAPISVTSPEAARIARVWQSDPQPDASITRADVRDRWLDLDLYAKPPFAPELTGLPIEYRVLLVYCADRALGERMGVREGAPGPPPAARGDLHRAARLACDVGKATADLADRATLEKAFTCRGSEDVRLHVVDEDGRPTVASFTITDAAGRVYPAKYRRAAPDFFFQSQVYRQDGESVALPPGDYRFVVTRGPEYVAETRAVTVPPPGAGAPREESFHLRRWVDAAGAGWFSGDHHVHAAGCAHYDAPTEGVFPEDIWRHVRGEDLRVGSILTWGPCYWFQKRFFSGRVHPLSTDAQVIRYDVEVSGFGSHKSGHLVLLGLADQDYPRAERLEDWPHLGLTVLGWAKTQGATTGAAHSGNGLAVDDTSLPSFQMPKFDGIGANEYVVDVTHEVPGKDGAPAPAIDFLSAVDTPYVWELSVWYHALNAGFRTRLAGESDFPCIYEQRLGFGRTYVKLDDRARVDFDAWRRGLAAGRSYVSDGTSHLMDFSLEDPASGARATVGDGASELRLPRGAKGAVRARVRVAAWLDPTPHPEIASRPYTEQPFWAAERARIGSTREVPVELVVDGAAVAKKTVVADGAIRDLTFDGVAIDRSSWVAVRILPSSHTNPIFVLVGDAPVRADRRSIDWLRRAVDVCWSQKAATYQPSELPAAKAAYDHARAVYDRRLSEAAAR